MSQKTWTYDIETNKNTLEVIKGQWFGQCEVGINMEEEAEELAKMCLQEEKTGLTK